MSTKRRFEETDSAMHPDRARLTKRFKHTSDKSSKGPGSYNATKNSKHKAREGTMNWAKKRARAIERTLQKDRESMPADKVEDLKRELQSHRRAIQDSERKKHRAHMITKYHMVRFFERKKAERLEKQLRKRLAQTTDEDEIASLKADIHIAEIDRLYAVNFPYLERYQSLYPAGKNDEAQTDAPASDDKSAAELALRSKRPPMWTVIEEAAAQGVEFLERIRDRESEMPSTGSARKTQPNKTKSPKSLSSTKTKNSVTSAGQAQHASQGAKTKTLKDNRRSRRSDLVRDDWRKTEDEDIDEDEDGGGFFDFGPAATT